MFVRALTPLIRDTTETNDVEGHSRLRWHKYITTATLWRHLIALAAARRQLLHVSDIFALVLTTYRPWILEAPRIKPEKNRHQQMEGALRAPPFFCRSFFGIMRGAVSIQGRKVVSTSANTSYDEYAVSVFFLLMYVRIDLFALGTDCWRQGNAV